MSITRIPDAKTLVSQIDALNNTYQCECDKILQNLNSCHSNYFLGRGRYFSNPSNRNKLANKMKEAIEKNTLLLSQISEIKNDENYQYVAHTNGKIKIDWLKKEGLCTKYLNLFKKYLQELPNKPYYQSFEEAVRSIQEKADKDLCKNGGYKFIDTVCLGWDWFCRDAHHNWPKNPYSIQQEFDYLTRNIKSTKEAKKTYNLGRKLGILDHEKIDYSSCSRLDNSPTTIIEFIDHIKTFNNVKLSPPLKVKLGVTLGKIGLIFKQCFACTCITEFFEDDKERTPLNYSDYGYSSYSTTALIGQNARNLSTGQYGAVAVSFSGVNTLECVDTCGKCCLCFFCCIPSLIRNCIRVCAD